MLCYNSKGRRLDPSWCQWIFHWHKILLIALWLCGDSASNRNEYQEHFLGGKGGRCVRLTNLPPSCAVVTKSGNLNFMEFSRPVQACNGTALPFTLIQRISYLQNFRAPPRGSRDSSSEQLRGAGWLSYLLTNYTTWRTVTPNSERLHVIFPKFDNGRILWRKQ